MVVCSHDAVKTVIQVKFYQLSANPARLTSRFHRYRFALLVPVVNTVECQFLRRGILRAVTGLIRQVQFSGSRLLHDLLDGWLHRNCWLLLRRGRNRWPRFHRTEIPTGKRRVSRVCDSTSGNGEQNEDECNPDHRWTPELSMVVVECG
jgi:hypothetical protein